MGRAPRILALALLLASAAAIGVQTYGGAVPLGLFNHGRALYAALAHGLLALLLAAAVLLAWELRTARRTRAGALVPRLLVAALLLELGVTAVDLGLVSRSPTAPLGGPYWELRAGSGAWVLLRKSARGLGFRAEAPYAPDPPAPRVLFLGDSYTEGSASRLACNYPQVAERALRARLGRPVQIMNAGVAGYGPVEAANLLELLVERGYAFDALVYNLFLENDFTDDLPGTERRAVAGLPFRFPEAPFLRWLHPLNTRAYRYALFLRATARLPRDEGARAHREEGACRARGTPLEAVTPALRALVERHLADNYAPGRARTAEGEVAAALARMRAVAEARGAPFAVVVFPDRIRADPEIRRLLPLRPERWELGRLQRWAERELRPRSDAWVDVTPALRGRPGLYRPEDTHLSDAGNRVAGEHVAAELAPFVARAIGRGSGGGGAP